MYDCYSCKYLISNILNENIQFIEQLSVWVTARFRYFDESFCQMALSNTNLKRELKNSPLHFPQEYDIKKNNATNGKIAHRVPSRERRPSAASRLRRRALGSPGSGPRERDGVTPRYRRQSAHNRANAGGTAEGRAFRPRVL